jgi:hypothetical protein
MRPLTFINGVIFGSAAALGAVLTLVICFRWAMTLDTSLDQTVVSSDLPLDQLVLYVAVFLGFAALAGVSFWTGLKRRPTRWFWQYLSALTLVAVVVFFLADQENRARELVWVALFGLLAALVLLAAAYSGLLRQIQRWLGT